MLVCDFKPFIRFAETIRYKSHGEPVNVFDARIYAILSGVAKMKINDASYDLHEGDVFFCAGGSCYCIEAAETCRIACLNFDFTQQRNHVTACMPPHKIRDGGVRYGLFERVEDADELNGHVFLSGEHEIHARVRQIVREYAGKAPFYREKCEALLCTVLVDLCRCCRAEENKPHRAIETVTEYVRQNIHRRITNAELARLVGYHEYHLNRIFLKHTEKTVHQYILSMRIAEAKRQLMRTDKLIWEIAADTGFNSSTHFCNCFKEANGYSPTQYRKNKQHTSI